MPANPAPAITSLDTQTIVVLLAAIAIGALTRATKPGTAPAWLQVPSRARPAVALALGQLAGVASALAAGVPWSTAAKLGLLSTALAVLGHDVGIEGLRGGRELTAPALVQRLLGAKPAETPAAGTAFVDVGERRITPAKGAEQRERDKRP